MDYITNYIITFLAGSTHTRTPLTTHQLEKRTSLINSLYNFSAWHTTIILRGDSLLSY